MKLALATLLVAACDAQVDAGYAGQPLARLSGTAAGFGVADLGDGALPLARLEQLVRGSAAAFRLLIVDACRSGALTRIKGGSSVPAPTLRLTERLPADGVVVWTSSSANEDAQESDELGGSFFLVMQGGAGGPVVADVGARDVERGVSLRAGRYFVRARALDHLLEGTVVTMRSSGTSRWVATSSTRREFPDIG
jgi:hypothetical protein